MSVMIALQPRTLCHFDTVPQKLYNAELGEYHTYGVRVSAPDQSYILSDISPCKKTAEHIVETLNYYQVSPVHVQDVIMDLLP